MRYVILLAVTLITSFVPLTEDWAWHERPTSWVVFNVASLFVLEVFALVPELRHAARVAGVAVASNLVALALGDGSLPNPMQLEANGYVVAFNTMDALLVLVWPLYVLGCVRLVVSAVHRTRDGI